VMLGANIGSTVIVQLLAFDVSVIAPLLVLAGYLLHRRGARDWGEVFVGLGLLLFALHQFLVLLGPVTSNPMSREFFGALSSHIVFLVLVGVALTWATHSSVAIVLLAMS